MKNNFNLMVLKNVKPIRGYDAYALILLFGIRDFIIF